MDIYQRYGPAVRRKCERILQNTHDAEDITHELFTDLMMQGTPDVSLAYLYRAATNRCLNALRDQQRRARLRDLHGDVLLSSPPSEPNTSLLNFELLCRLFAQIDPETQETVVYRYLDHLSLEEISELTGVSARAISKRLLKARTALHALCAEEVLL